MKGLKKLFWVLWRVVLYFNGHPILVMFPLVLSILTESYPYFFKMARIWAKFILLVWVLL
jgi:1-acyl-sn-glycerol-3-phosphate acyltransferase